MAMDRALVAFRTRKNKEKSEIGKEPSKLATFKGRSINYVYILKKYIYILKDKLIAYGIIWSSKSK